MQKFGVWIQKQQRYRVAKSLYNALLEKEPTLWIKAEIIICKENKGFALYKIS